MKSMFKAKDISTDGVVVAPDPQWRGEGMRDLLKEWCHQGRIVCPCCNERVLAKAGEFIRWHFAHKIRTECPYANENAERLTGRLMLYDWLVGQSNRADVELEVPIDGAEAPAALDVVITIGGRRFGYWFVNKNLRDESRQALLDAYAMANNRGIAGHFVFSSRLLKTVEWMKHRVVLSPTQSSLLMPSRYRTSRPIGHCLHFLTTSDRSLTSLRGIQATHFHKTFDVNRWLCHPLERVSIDPDSGEPVHPYITRR